MFLLFIKGKEISNHDDLHERSTTLVLFCIWFLLQRAYRSLQRVWKEEVDFDSAVDSISMKAASIDLCSYLGDSQTLLDLSFIASLGRCDTQGCCLWA